MPIALTTAKDPGDMDVTTYGEVKIVTFSLWPNLNMIDITTEYGNTVAGEWVRSNLGMAAQNQFRVEGSDYAAMVTALSLDGDEPIYVGAARVLYQWLLDAGHFVGTIV
jgi:hypothetical protein